ncbi:MAG: hypothetical protein Tp172MES766071_5 [Prokaryotic dsDNA virus sp.]|nr:MAG: hypothetical protein Tp172MES766071_5 [Prokaryotic dsDNA virus sp.]|tara:strand:- start:5375 stop:5860 length:486 start_codon:yes stop_codon:yes gene_type:complete
MRLELYRYSSEKDSTLGMLFIVDDETNKKDFLCFTLEDEKREVKVYGETRIPEGTYPIKYRTEGGYFAKYKKRFPNLHNDERGVLHIDDVPNFEYILIHCGNDTSHTHGCVLVGDVISQNINKEPFLGQSSNCYKRIYPKISNILESQKHLSIKIINFEEI